VPRDSDPRKTTPGFHVAFVVVDRLYSGITCGHLPSHLLSKTIEIQIHGTVIFAVVSYWCETCSPTLMEEQRQKVFVNRMLRRIFGPKRDEKSDCTKVHNEDLHNLYSLPNIIRVIKLKSLR
jgi:hypothetical protein